MAFVDQASVTPEHKLLHLRQHFSGEDIRLWLATQQWLVWNGNSIEIGDEYHCISKNKKMSNPSDQETRDTMILIVILIIILV